MPSEASRKKAEEIAGPHRIVTDCWYSCPQATEDGEFVCCDDSRRGGPCDCGRAELVDDFAAALDAARAEGLQEGRERERWACHEAVDEPDSGCRCSIRYMRAIAARGPMRGPEEE